MSDVVRPSPIVLGSIALDCEDPRELGEFYGELTGQQVAVVTEDFVVVGSTPPYLTMHRVADHRPPTWPDGELPKQLHLDFGVADLAATEKLALRIGARRADTQPAPDRFLVFLDPAGHPFCLTTVIP